MPNRASIQKSPGNASACLTKSVHQKLKFYVYDNVNLTEYLHRHESQRPPARNTVVL